MSKKRKPSPNAIRDGLALRLYGQGKTPSEIRRALGNLIIDDGSRIRTKPAPSISEPLASEKSDDFRKEYIAWRMRGGKPADKPRREKLEIVKPSDRPFCVFGANGETKTTLGPFPSCVAVYALVDPRDNTVRYVGKTTCQELRLKEHLESAGNKSRRCRWIADLLASGMKPSMVILDRVSAARWEHVERRWIAFYSRRGSLYNVEIGGAGYLHAARMEERRLKMADRPNEFDHSAGLSRFPTR